mmetsp:Transcript_374/g.672  ORF Transcript_374/g.672 Transcript_374/m.672 type:complete len:279 (+) Transcript_374:95-931(+)|eukprot:CAMPEP_0119299672 /NCGR_PEP_ID=MMETSP1333-20130426/1719_1 /TAXON_ID=418940 /ORGANISM="Scyphosphaera apsteinii, Strain RCC1455" /LENGTH=278 /DNA_ID=CAMNT_0007301175 /DNA_START=83 /DNA_END=919 /DNA_ORIENTATION=+
MVAHLLLPKIISLCTSSALHTPTCHAHPPRMQIEEHWYYDNVEFMNEPFKFILDHPEEFGEAMQAMAQYQFMTNQDSRPWGDLPMYLGEGAQLKQSLLEKSMQANELARVIMTADLQTMKRLADDAKFAEKKQLFENLATLPAHNRGMLAIHEVISSMSGANQLPALTAFDGDVQVACRKVAEANEALRMLDDKYTTLFLAVRLTAKLSGAAAQMKADRERGWYEEGAWEMKADIEAGTERGWQSEAERGWTKSEAERGQRARQSKAEQGWQSKADRE